MTLYAGLDAGEKATHLCVVDGEGGIVWRSACATEAEALVFTLGKHAPGPPARGTCHHALKSPAAGRACG